MEIKEIKEIITLLEESNLNKLKLKEGDFELLLEKSADRLNQGHPIPPPAPHHMPLQAPYSAANHVPDAGTPQTKEMLNDDSSALVTSPMVGTFYATPAPNDPPFVKVGDMVDEDTVVCVIEAMKVMNEVKSGIKGRVKEVLCKTAQPVEFKTNLFKIELL